MDFELNSIGDKDETVKESWQTHASGRLVMDKPEKMENTHEVPANIKRRCHIEHTLPEFYDFMWKREYGLGPMFQLIEHIWRNDYEACCPLTEYTAPDASGYTMYPVYFDCCIQLMMAIVAWDTPLDIFKTYVPLGCGTFNLYKTSFQKGKKLWCHTDCSKSYSADGPRLDSMDVITADLCVIDEDGDVVAHRLACTSLD